jgi:hypothetical protein
MRRKHCCLRELKRQESVDPRVSRSLKGGLSKSLGVGVVLPVRNSESRDLVHVEAPNSVLMRKRSCLLEIVGCSPSSSRHLSADPINNIQTRLPDIDILLNTSFSIRRKAPTCESLSFTKPTLPWAVGVSQWTMKLN